MSYEIDGRTNGPAITWPGRARIADMVTFDFDAEYLRMSSAASKGTTIRPRHNRGGRNRNTGKKRGYTETHHGTASRGSQGA